MIETRKAESYNVEDLKAFGWQETQTEKRRSGPIRHTYYIMARETTMPHYHEYRKYEIEYESARQQMRPSESVDFCTAFILFLLFILPGIIYVYVKKKKIKEIEDHNQQCRIRMRNAVRNAQNIK